MRLLGQGRQGFLDLGQLLGQRKRGTVNFPQAILGRNEDWTGCLGGIVRFPDPFGAVQQQTRRGMSLARVNGFQYSHTCSFPIKVSM